MPFSMEDVVNAVTILTNPNREKMMPPRVTKVASPIVNGAAKTTPNSTPNPAMGLLSRGVDVSELVSQYISLLIYGENRTGKTTLACSFPKPLALFSFEPNKTGGAASVASPQYKGVKLFRIKYKRAFDDDNSVFEGTEQAMQLVEELTRDTYFNTVVVDSATSMQDLYLQEILKVDKLPEQLKVGRDGISGEDYKKRSELTKEGLRPFLNLKKHVVIIAKERDHNPPKEEKLNPNTGKVSPDMRPKALRGVGKYSYFCADLGGATALWLNDACDLIARAFKTERLEERTVSMGELGDSVQEVHTGEYVHRLLIKKTPPYEAGFRTPVKNCPDYIDDATYDKIAKVLKGEKL